MKFPKVLYVKIEDGGTGPNYLAAYDNLADAAEMSVKIRIASYTLVATQNVEGVVETSKARISRE